MNINWKVSEFKCKYVYNLKIVDICYENLEILTDIEKKAGSLIWYGASNQKRMKQNHNNNNNDNNENHNFQEFPYFIAKSENSP